MWKEFKAFAMKGNVIDLAVGVIIGGAFGKIVSSLVSDIIMPIIGLLLGRLPFTDLFLVLAKGAAGDGNYNTLEEARSAGAVTLNYGIFLSNIIDFLIIAFSIFIVIKQIERFTRKKEKQPAPAKTKTCRYCHSEIHLEATKCPQCTADL